MRMRCHPVQITKLWWWSPHKLGLLAILGVLNRAYQWIPIHVRHWRISADMCVARHIYCMHLLALIRVFCYLDVLTSVKQVQKSTFFAVIAVRNGLRPKFQVRIQVHVPCLDSNGATLQGVVLILQNPLDEPKLHVYSICTSINHLSASK